MSVRKTYAIEIYDQSTNDLHGVWSDGLSLEYELKVNEVSICAWVVKPDHPVINLIDKDDRIIIYITGNDSKIDFYFWEKDFQGLYRETQISTDENGNEYHILIFVTLNEVLTRAIVAYKAGTNNRSRLVGTTAEGVFSNVFLHNCSALGTIADGRERDAPDLVGTSAAAHDVAWGTTIFEYRCAWKNVFLALKEITEANSAWFYVGRNTITGALFVRTSGYNDISDEVIFDINLTNVSGSSKSPNTLNEKTVAIVGGKGIEDSRTLSVSTGTNYDITTDNYEVFVDYKDSDDADILSKRGDIALSKKEAVQIIKVKIAQSEGYGYKTDYDLGDVVGLIDENGNLVTRQIKGVQIKFSPFLEIKITLGTLL